MKKNLLIYTSILAAMLLQSGCLRTSKRPAWTSSNSNPAWVDQVQSNSVRPTASSLNLNPLRAETSSAGGFEYDRLPASDKPAQSTQNSAPLSRIEGLYNQASGESRGLNLRQYGYRQLQIRHARTMGFQRGSDEDNLESAETSDDSALMLLDPGGPIDADYLIGPGDELTFRLTGALDLKEQMVVQRDGTIFLPQVGSITVAGIRSGELNGLVKDAIEEQYAPVEVDASLGRLHAIRILLLGHAGKPGLYFLPANATLMDALMVAGGISNDGTLRSLVLQRAGHDDQAVDLYDFLQDRGEVENIRLVSGDVIRIPAIGATAAIAGPMLEGIYELNPQNSVLADIIQYAGGLNAFTRQERVLLERTKGDLTRELITLNPAAGGQNQALEDGDVVLFDTAYDSVNGQVTLAGQMVSPGRYPFTEGMTLSSLLKQGDGFLIDASLERVLVERRLGARRAYDIRPDDAEGEVRSELIWVDLPALLAGDPQADLPLKRLDKVTVFPQAAVRDVPQISILGAVRQPGTYDLSSGMRVRDALLLAGKTTPDAFGGESMIVRRNRAGEGRHLDVNLIPFDLNGALDGQEESNLPLHNFDQVVIRRVQELQVSVTIEGRVHFPGTYILPDGSKITDLLSAAGGLLPEADLRASVFARDSVRQQQNAQLSDMQRRNQEQMMRVRDEVTRDGYSNEVVANQLALKGLNTLDSNARRYQAIGRIVLDLQQNEFPETVDNLSLENGDRLVIPRRRNTVAVLGRIYNPNTFICRDQEKMRVKEYIAMAGGLQEDADQKQFYVLLASGEVYSAAQVGRRSLNNYVPLPGDTILVPQAPLDRSLKSKTMDSLMIMRQVAELGLVASAIPQVDGAVTPSVSIESQSTENQGAAVQAGGYEPIVGGAQ